MTYGLKPAVNTQTIFIYATSNTYISNLLICAEVSGAVDVHVQPAGSTTKYALYSGLYVGKGDTFGCSALKLSPGDSLYVTSASGGHTFTAFSDEV